MTTKIKVSSIPTVLPKMMTTRLQDAYILRSRIISKQTPSLPRSSGKPRRAGRRNKIVSPEINLVSKLVSSTCKGRRSRRNHAATPWRSITASFKRCEEDNLGQGQDSTKSISLKASPRTTGGCCPTRDIDKEEEGYREQCTDCAQTALEHIHKRLGMAAYELVDIGDSSAFKGRRFENCFYLHSNFKAKPRGSHPSQTVLFFAELKVGFKLPMTVNHYCPLGPADQVNTGLNGCLACDSTDPIHHPNDQSLFYVGTEQMSFLSG